MRTVEPARPQDRERPPSPPPGESVTASELVGQQLGGVKARAVGEHRRQLVVCGVIVASVGTDPAAITSMCAVSARDLPVVDTLAAIAAQDPTGVLVIEAGEDAFAFEVIRGRLTGARGTGKLDRLESFVAEVHRKQPDRFGPNPDFGPDAPAWLQVARTFVEERVLDQLSLCLAPGARMTLIRGDIQWIGTRLPDGVGPTLAHVLLEHARRCDETPRILATLGSLRRVPIPMAEPGARPARPDKVRSASESWDFFDDPDPAALGEWEDAQRVWSLCDGESTVAEVIDAAMLGRFRGALALHTLTKAKHVVLADPEAAVLGVAESSPGAAVIQMRQPTPRLGNASPASRVAVDAGDPAANAPPEPEGIDGDPESSGTGYSMVMKRMRQRRRTPATSAPRPPQLYFEAPRPERQVVDVVVPPPAVPTFAPELVAQAEAPTRRETIPMMIGEDDPAERSMLADRSMAASKAMDRVLPSPRVVMAVLAATGGIALLAALLAMM
jgi:hypothetical protein